MSVMLMVTMSRLLSQLLGVGEPMFSLALRQLEGATGNEGIDVRLTADIISKKHAAMKALGLDVRDTTGPEFYHSLVSLAKLHDVFLAKRLGADDPSDVSDMLRRIRIAAQNVHVPREAWVVKHSVMRRLLKATPPRAAQRALGYRSIDSMLKREPIALIMAAVRIVEAEKWQYAFVAGYRNLKPLDFEMRSIEILQPDTARWRKMAEPYTRRTHQNLTNLKELGAIVILPLPVASLPGITLTVFPLVLHYINEIRVYSSLFKLTQVRPDFGKIVTDAILRDPSDHISIHGRPIHWRLAHRHFGKSDAAVPELFEPYLTIEDLEWRKAESVLYELEPALQFWDDLDYVGAIFDGSPISLALGDVAACAVNKLPYEFRSIGRMRQSLWNELHQRYLAHPALERHVLRQLDTTSTEPGPLALSRVHVT